MVDRQVFLSYSLEDTDTARHLVRAIEARGWAISWERYEEPDAIATIALREALNAADCVVVLWSTHSVGSTAIREEARLARGRGVLIQATLDEAPVPMPFLLDDPTPLTDEWSLATLVRQIARVLHDESGSAAGGAEERAPDVRARLESRVLDVAEQHADAGELDDAIGIYERWVGEKPDDMKAVRRLGDLYLAADREVDAARRYERVAEHYASAGFLVPAIETYQRIVELAPYEGAFRVRLDELTEAKERQTTGTQRAMSAVQFTLTAPSYVRPGETFLLDVWAHREEERAELLRRFRDDSSGDEVARGPGPALTARIHIDGLDVEGPEQGLRWDRGLGLGSFEVSTPPDTARGGRGGLAGIHFLGLQIARIHFLVQIGDGAEEREIIPSRQERHTRAIASYAREDRGAVEARIRAFERAAPGVEVSLDVLELRERADGLSGFLDEISSCDVLYLFWSAHAARSTDVEREWRYALRLRGIDFIDPVPLVSPELAPPPPELATLLGGDWHVVPEVPGAGSGPEAER